MQEGIVGAKDLSGRIKADKGLESALGKIVCNCWSLSWFES